MNKLSTVKEVLGTWYTHFNGKLSTAKEAFSALYTLFKRYVKHPGVLWWTLLPMSVLLAFNLIVSGGGIAPVLFCALIVLLDMITTLNKIALSNVQKIDAEVWEKAINMLFEDKEED